MRSFRRALPALAAGLIAAVLCAAGAPPASAAPAALPADPAARGYVGLCNESGENVTGGDIDTKPFVWKAVSSSRPPAAFQGRGENAVLTAHQPQTGTRPGDWSGLAITAASFYSTPSHPAVQATYADLSLRDFMAQFPPRANGLLVLRMSYGKAGFGLYGSTYPVTVIQVTGSRWQVVRGGTVDCAKARSVSNEQLTGAASKSDVTPRRPAASQHVALHGHPGTTISTALRTGTHDGAVSLNGDGTAEPQRASSASATSTASGSPWLLWTLFGLVLVLALALLLVLRIRRTTPAPSGKDERP